MWKVVTSSNLNPPLKLFFYLQILTNNNLLLKIYCENIVKILRQYFHSFIHMFPFFFLLFFLHHTRIPIYLILSFFFFFFFSTFHFQNLPLYFFIQLSPFLLFFFSFSTIIFKHTQIRMERKEKSPLLYHTATAAPPPHRCCSTTHTSLFFFS